MPSSSVLFFLSSRPPLCPSPRDCIVRASKRISTTCSLLLLLFFPSFHFPSFHGFEHRHGLDALSRAASLASSHHTRRPFRIPVLIILNVCPQRTRCATTLPLGSERTDDDQDGGHHQHVATPEPLGVPEGCVRHLRRARGDRETPQGGRLSRGGGGPLEAHLDAVQRREGVRQLQGLMARARMMCGCNPRGGGGCEGGGTERDGGFAGYGPQRDGQGDAGRGGSRDHGFAENSREAVEREAWREMRRDRGGT